MSLLKLVLISTFCMLANCSINEPTAPQVSMASVKVEFYIFSTTTPNVSAATIYDNGVFVTSIPPRTRATISVSVGDSLKATWQDYDISQFGFTVRRSTVVRDSMTWRLL